MMNQQGMQVSRAAPVFAALGDPVRLEIVVHLCKDGPQSTIHLTHGTAISRQAVTKHLRMLEDAGIVHSKRVGRDRQWKIQKRQLDKVRLYLEHISCQWDATIERIRRFVEENTS